MNTNQQLAAAIALVISLILPACGPGRTVDASLLSTRTLTPIPAFTPVLSVTARPSVPTEGSSSITLVNGTLIDGTGADPVPEAVVVIKGNQIVAVGSRSQVEIPEDTQMIDVQGGTILPGLIDAHVHYAYSNTARWAQAGITTVRSLGEGRWGSVCKRKSLEGSHARVVSAGPIMTVPKGYPIRMFGSDAAVAVRSPEEARRWTTLLLGPELCQDVIKVALDAGPQLSDEELQAIVEAAHERNTVVSAHVTYTRDLTKALTAGVDDMAHMIRDPLPEEVITQLIAQDVYVVPTIKIFSMLRIPSSNRDSLRRFVAAGGKVAVGTDYNNPEFPEDMYLLEMEAMQQAGMTPMQVLVAATMNGAHVCNLDQEIGTLQPGKMADVLVVEGNPLENLKALADVRLVIHGGAVIRDEIP